MFPCSCQVVAENRLTTWLLGTSQPISVMLPTHRFSSSKAGLLSWLSKRPSFLLNNLVIRWLGLTCVVFGFIWFAGPRLANSMSLGFEYPPLPNPAPPSHIQRPSNPPHQPTKQEQDVWEPRKNEVRDAFKHAWSGYKSIAYPNDELLSLSGGTSNKFVLFPLSLHCVEFFSKRFNGWGVTLFDSLSTMWIMGLRDEFAEAVDSIRDLQFHATKVN